MFAITTAIFPFLSTGEGGGGDAPAAGGLLTMLPMILIFGALMYFMLYRPQKKQQRAMEDMRNSLRVGDEITTNSGIIAKIIQIKDDFIVVETGNDKTKLKLAKWAIRSIDKREDDEEEDEDGEE